MAQLIEALEITDENVKVEVRDANNKILAVYDGKNSIPAAFNERILTGISFTRSSSSIIFYVEG